MKEYTSYLTSQKFWMSILILAVTFAILALIKKYLIKKVAYSGKKDQHRNAFIGVIFSIAQYIVILVAVVIILRLHDVNIMSIVTGLGIIATIIGLALQDTLKDIIAGINIYNSNFYKVGDMVKYNGEECDVKYFSARVTKFESIFTGSTYTVCNSSTTSIEKIKDIKTLILEFEFKEDAVKINGAYDKAVERIKEIEEVKEVSNLGLIYFGKQGPAYGILYRCPAHKDLLTRMKITQILYDEVNKAGLSPIFDGDIEVSINKMIKE